MKFNQNNYNTILQILLFVVFSVVIMQVAYTQEKNRIRLIYKLDAAQKVNANGKMVPVFEYDITPDIENNLKKAGYKISEAKEWNYNMSLTIEYSERIKRDQYFGDRVMISLFKITLRDIRDSVLFIIEPNSVGETPKMRVKEYVNNQLSKDISERLNVEDEIHFVISKYSKELNSNDTLTNKTIFQRLHYLVRMYELNNILAEKPFKEALLSPDPRQRWIGKFGLLKLGMVPFMDSKYYYPYQMVNVLASFKGIVAMNFLKERELTEKYKTDTRDITMREFILKYGGPAIKVIVDNIRCEKIMNAHDGFWYGGGQISETRSDRVLKSLRKDRWEKFIPRTYKPSESFILKWAWKPAYREVALKTIKNELLKEYPKMSRKSLLAYHQVLIDILSEIGDESTIANLQNYQEKYPLLANECQSAIKSIEQRKEL